MKHLFTLVLATMFFMGYSQSIDSTEIKLDHYKEMFIKGLISSQEYDKLKNQVLNLEPKKKVESFTSLSLKEKKCRRVGIACLSTGGVMTFIGLDLIGTAYSLKANQIDDNPYIGSSKEFRNLVYSGTMLLLSSLNFWTAGGIEFGIANRYRHKMEQKKVSLNIEPAMISGPNLITGMQATLSF